MVEMNHMQPHIEDIKFSLAQCDVSVSSKLSLQATKPTKSYIEVTFNKENDPAYFTFIIF